MAQRSIKSKPVQGNAVLVLIDIAVGNIKER